MKMSEEKGNILNTFEWHLIPAQKEFYDELEHRYFLNASLHPIKIGFGHNTRRVEIIAYGDATKEDVAVQEKPERREAPQYMEADIKDPKLEIFEGEIIEEDV